ncbi:MAG: hypothetical protein AB8F94_12635 [Saprospiraceae bacterium]
MKKNLFRLSALQFLFFAFGAMLFITSCQKASLQETTNEQSVEITTVDFLTVQKTILEYVFRIETKDLTDAQIDENYNELIKTIPIDEQEALVKIVEEALIKQLEIPASAGIRSSSETLSNGIAQDDFGRSVFTVGNKVYVGAPGEQKVFEYKKTGGSYSLVGEITPTGMSDDFGYHVSVSGSWMAVSAPDFGQPFGRPGQVFLFKKQGNSWVQKDVLNGPAGEVNFGGDGLVLQGTTLATVSRGTGFPSPGGTISVYKKSGNNWTLDGSIFRPTFDWLAIDMNESGTRIAGTGFVGNFAGNVRASIFVKSGSDWVLEDDVFVTSPVPFGVALPRDIAIDGNQMVLTALIPGSTHWVFNNNGGDWELEQELNHPAGLPFTNRWADMHGGKIVIGAASGNNFLPDAVHVFEQSGGTWDYTESLSGDGDDAIMWSVAISGNTIVAGLPGTGFPPTVASGKVVVFD